MPSRSSAAGPRLSSVLAGQHADLSADLLDVSHDLDLDGGGGGDDALLTLRDLQLHSTTSRARGDGGKKSHINSGNSRGRPSWGPPPTAFETREKEKMRLMQGLQDDWAGVNVSGRHPINAAADLEEEEEEGKDSIAEFSTGRTATTTTAAGGPRASLIAAAKRGLGGMEAGRKGAKPRFSLFAKPAFAGSETTSGTHGGAGSSQAADGGAPSATSAAVAAAAAKAEAGGYDASPSGEASAAASGSGAGARVGRPTEQDAVADGKAESKEAAAKQLAQLKLMNDTFEGYEKMLHGTTEQIDVFALRIDDTNKLLDIYIDLLRQSEKTQTLLTDPEWKGATEDTTAHARALEQAAAETARLQAQAAEADRQAEALQAATIQRAAATAGSGARGARGARGAAAGGGSLAGRSASGTAARQSTVARGASTATRPSRGGPPPAASARTAAAGRASTAPSTSGIARGRPTITRGASTATGRASSATGSGTTRTIVR